MLVDDIIEKVRTFNDEDLERLRLYVNWETKQREKNRRENDLNRYQEAFHKVMPTWNKDGILTIDQVDKHVSACKIYFNYNPCFKIDAPYPIESAFRIELWRCGDSWRIRIILHEGFSRAWIDYESLNGEPMTLTSDETDYASVSDQLIKRPQIAYLLASHREFYDRFFQALRLIE